MFLSIIYKTIWISIIVTIITVIIAVPTAYYIVRSRHKEKLIYLVIIPFWDKLFDKNLFLDMAILGSNGFLNIMLKKFGFIDNYYPVFI